MKERKWLRIAPTACVLLMLILMGDQGRVGSATVVAVLLHESGHLLAAWLLGVRMRGLRLDLLGARLDTDGRMLSFGEEWLLAAGGPMASLLTAALAALLWTACAWARAFSCVSLVLGLLNLLPIRSFDGGRMLACSLQAVADAKVSARVLNCTSFLALFLLWSASVYVLLRVGDGLSLFCFSLSLFLRFFDEEDF